MVVLNLSGIQILLYFVYIFIIHRQDSDSIIKNVNFSTSHRKKLMTVGINFQNILIKKNYECYHYKDANFS